MSLIRRIANLFTRAEVDREIDAELRSHIAMRMEDNIAAGMTEEEARRDALVRFGSRAATKEKVAGMDAALALDSVWSDFRFAMRQLARNRGFAFTAIAVLALGMSASVAIFAFVDAALIRPLPYADPARLVGLFESTPMGPRFHLSYLDYLDWKRMNSVFTSVEAFDNNKLVVTTASGAQQAEGATVSAGFFRVLGVAPIAGRDFQEGEDRMGAAPVAMLSHSCWQNRYGGRPDVVGRMVVLDGASHTIVGVLPADFHFAPAGPAEFWTAMQEATDPDSRGGHGILAVGRLKGGVTLGTASAEMDTIAGQLARQYPDADAGRGATLVGLTDAIVGNIRPILLLLLSGAGLLLLIACVNVSSLTLLRAESRQREIAVRGALGASHARLVRQFATESLTLVAIGSVLGMSAAYGAMHLLIRLIPVNLLTGMPFLAGLGTGAHVPLFAGAIAFLSWLMLSLTPVVRLLLLNLQNGLNEGSRTAAGTLWRRLGANLVVLELCTAMVMLVGAGLLAKSFYRLLRTEIGFQPDHLATLSLRAPSSSYGRDQQVAALAQRLIGEERRLPGVRSVAVAHQLPVANLAGGNTTFDIVGRPGHGESKEAHSRRVSADYFNTLQTRLERGRFFEESEDASRPHVAILNQAFARAYFPGEDPIGKQLQFDPSEPVATIVGVVDDIKEGPLEKQPEPTLYMPFAQGPERGFYLVVRTAVPPQALMPSLAETVRRIDPGIWVAGEETMVERIDQSQSAYLYRSAAYLVGGFAGMALLLGVVGLYGVIAYSVSQRTREIGVRMALGATRGSVQGLVLKEAGRLAGAGILAGLACSVGTGMSMRSLLFGTKAWDVPILAGVAGVLAASAMLASYVPARRAASVNPVEALRAE